MIKKLTIGAVLTSALLFTACGGGGSSSDNESNEGTERNEGVNEQVEGNGGLPACTVSGDTVLVNEGTECSDNGAKLECKNNVVTYNDSLSSPTITINGRTYTCQ